MRYFGTDGIRREGKFFLENGGEFLSRFSYAIRAAIQPKAVVIGRDTRTTGERISEVLSDNLCLQGISVIDIGVCPTPELCYQSYERECVGIMVSASHNPPEYNGLKLLINGLKCDEERERKIEKLLDGDILYDSMRKGELTRISGAENYIKRLVRSNRTDLTGVKVLLDCCHGATCGCAEEIFRRLGASVSVINGDKDGERINVSSGATCTDGLNADGYDIAFAYDGDGDRVIAKFAGGRVWDGDNMIYVLAKYYGVRDAVITVMSNYGLEQALLSEKIIPHRVPVGDKYIQDEMIKHGYILGAEQSGHVITEYKLLTGDGVMTSIRLIAAIRAVGRAEFMRYPQVLVNVKADKSLLDKISFNDLMDGIADEGGRLLIRASGTENLIRVLTECREEEVAEYYNRIAVQRIKDAF